MVVEVCANSLQSALVAEKSGATRIELCTELGVGGITPSYGMLALAREKLSIPVHVLIRPRSGNFTYSTLEFKQMLADVSLCAEMGFEGIVSGVLLSDLRPDLDRTAQLMEAASGLSFTFHRAFDWVENPLQCFAELEGLGVHTILSSGQQPKAVIGLELLKELHKQASSCTIMPGSGINAQNAGLFREAGFAAIHLSGLAALPAEEVPPPLSMNSPSLLREDISPESDAYIIRDVVNCVK